MTTQPETQQLNTENLIRTQVEKEDHDRYRLIILAPKADQRFLFAVTALNCEIAQCLTSTNEPMLAQIKLQWWFDALSEAVAGKYRKHPIISELQHTDADFNALIPLVSARQDEVEQDIKPTLKSTQDYAASTSGYLHKVMAGEHQDTGPFFTELGTVWGLISLLRGVIFHGAASQGLIPTDVMDSLKQAGEENFQGDMSIVIDTAAQSILSIASEKLHGLKGQLKGVKLSGRQKAMAKMTILADHYIQTIKKGQFKPAQIDFDKGQLKLLLKLIFYKGL